MCNSMIKDAPSWLLWTQGDEKKSAAANSIGTSEVVNLADKINVDFGKSETTVDVQKRV